MSFAAAAARSVRNASRAARRAGSRSVSGSPAEIEASMNMWFNTAIYAGGLIIAPYTAFTIYQELKHEHHEKHIFPHMKQRHKAFPWKESDCDLFDMHCKHAARGQLH